MVAALDQMRSYTHSAQDTGCAKASHATAKHRYLRIGQIALHRAGNRPPRRFDRHPDHVICFGASLFMLLFMGKNVFYAERDPGNWRAFDDYCVVSVTSRRALAYDDGGERILMNSLADHFRHSIQRYTGNIWQPAHPVTQYFEI